MSVRLRSLGENVYRFPWRMTGALELRGQDECWSVIYTFPFSTNERFIAGFADWHTADLATRLMADAWGLRYRPAQGVVA